MSRRKLLGGNRGSAIPQDISSEWKLDETTGAAFNDSNGVYNGTVSDVSLYTSTGKVGNAFDFSGKSHGNIVTGSNSDFEIYDGANNNPFSFSFWQYQPTGTGSSLELFIQIYTSGFVKIFMFGIVANNLRSELYSQSGNVLVSEVDQTSFNTGVKDTWRHITFVFDPLITEHSIIYINGVKATQTASGAALSSIKTGVASMRISGTNSGKMDEIKHYKRALPAEEVLGIYNAEL